MLRRIASHPQVSDYKTVPKTGRWGETNEGKPIKLPQLIKNQLNTTNKLKSSL